VPSTGPSLNLKYPLLSLRSPGSSLFLRRLLVTSILLSFFHKVLSTIKIQHKIPKTKTNHIVQYLRLNTDCLSVVLLGNLGVVLYTEYERELENILATINYLAQLHLP